MAVDDTKELAAAIAPEDAVVVAEVLRRLRDVVGDLPARADGNVNQRDLWNGLADALGVATAEAGS